MRSGHHRGLRAGHACQGVTRELERAACFLAVNRNRGPETQRPWRCAVASTTQRAGNGTRNKGSRQGIGKRAKSEATRDGQAEVLAEHSTDGWREMSQSRTWGTEAQGTHGREGEAVHHAPLERTTEDTMRLLPVPPDHQRIAEIFVLPGSKVMHEEPDDLIGHVRICGGPGGKPPGLPGSRWASFWMVVRYRATYNLGKPLDFIVKPTAD